MQTGAFLQLAVSLVLPGLLLADCMEGWVDGTSVGLGCLLADQNTQQQNYYEATAACQNHGEGGRLAEITSQAVFSPLIGPGQRRLGSHWSRASECCYASMPAILCHKEPARPSKATKNQR